VIKNDAHVFILISALLIQIKSLASDSTLLIVELMNDLEAL